MLRNTCKIIKFMDESHDMLVVCALTVVLILLLSEAMALKSLFFCDRKKYLLRNWIKSFSASPVHSRY